jgi:hypothetical protein
MLPGIVTRRGFRINNSIAQMATAGIAYRDGKDDGFPKRPFPAECQGD